MQSELYINEKNLIRSKKLQFQRDRNLRIRIKDSVLNMPEEKSRDCYEKKNEVVN